MIGGSSMSQFYQAMLLGPWISMTGSQKITLMMVKPNQKDLAFVAELAGNRPSHSVIDKQYALAEVLQRSALEAGRVQGESGYRIWVTIHNLQKILAILHFFVARLHLHVGISDAG
ncbi:MAG: hypothetical protein R3E79_60505 [Caldilineaceae bacterium]